MLKPAFQARFKRDFDRAVKRGGDMKKLEKIIMLLCAGRPLPEACRDHALENSRGYKNVRECHIEPDWLLIYKIRREASTLELIRTGTHSDLF